MGAKVPLTGTDTGGVTFGEVSFANIDTAASGNTALVAAVSDKKIRVLAVAVIGAGATDVYFNDGTANLFGGTRAAPISLDGSDGGAGFIIDYSPVGWFETAAVNRPLNLNCSTTGGVMGCVVYVLV